MAFNITTFHQTAVNRDFARKFQFHLLSFGPAAWGFTADDQIYVETLALPGRTINNIPVPFQGLTFNVPGVASYPGSASYKIMFRSDKDYSLRSKIENVTRLIWEESSSSGQFSIPSTQSVLSLGLVNKSNTVIRTYNLKGVYIQSIDDEQYDIKDTGNVSMIGATIAYQYWDVDPIGVTPISARDSAALGQLRQ